MAFEHKRIKIWDELIPPLDRITDQGSNLWIHPGFNDTSDGVIVLICLEAVDGKAWRVHAKLYPSKEQLRTWLWTFKAANVMAIALY